MIAVDHKLGISTPSGHNFDYLVKDMLALFEASIKDDELNAAMVIAMSSLGGSVEKTYQQHLRNDKCPE